MRGANVVRRRSVTNPGETADTTGAVNGGQADGGGSELLAGGSAAGDGSNGRDLGPAGPQAPVIQAAGPSGMPPGRQASGLASGPASGLGSAAAAQSLPGAPPAAGMVRTTHPQPKKPASARSRFAL